MGHAGNLPQSLFQHSPKLDLIIGYGLMCFAATKALTSVQIHHDCARFRLDSLQHEALPIH